MFARDFGDIFYSNVNPGGENNILFKLLRGWVGRFGIIHTDSVNIYDHLYRRKTMGKDRKKTCEKWNETRICRMQMCAPVSHRMDFPISKNCIRRISMRTTAIIISILFQWSSPFRLHSYIRASFDMNAATACQAHTSYKLLLAI